jgi:hypothetical protein
MEGFCNSQWIVARRALLSDKQHASAFEALAGADIHGRADTREITELVNWQTHAVTIASLGRLEERALLCARLM